MSQVEELLKQIEPKPHGLLVFKDVPMDVVRQWSEAVKGEPWSTMTLLALEGDMTIELVRDELTAQTSKNSWNAALDRVTRELKKSSIVPGIGPFDLELVLRILEELVVD